MARIFMLATLIVLFISSPALAGSFKAVPIRLYLDARTKTAVLKVTNEGAEKVTVQLDAKEWAQNETGKDTYTDTKDIIFFPKMAGIEAGEERIIRVGYKGKKTGAREGTYRLFIQELPVTKPGEMALKFALRLSIPVFIKPLKEVKEMSIQGAALEEGRVLVKVKNSGNAHFIVSKIKTIGLDASGAEVFSKDMGGWYVLPGITKTYTVDIPEQECGKASEIKVKVEVKRESMDAGLAVDTARCKRPEAPKEERPGLGKPMNREKEI